MKKVLSLFALVLMSCMGAWADVQVTSLNLLADGDVIYMHSNSADNWYFASDNSHPTSVIDACKFTLVAVNGQANTYYLQQGTKYVAAENAQAATNSNVTLMEESENAIPFTIVAHATVNGWKIQNNGNAISSGGSYWASNNAVRLSWTIYKVVPTITVTYNITATNNGKNPVNWTETKPVNLTGEAHTPELSYSYFSNFTITNDDKVVSEDNKTFNVTASHNLPMVPGKFYQIKFGDTYLKYIDDNNVTLKATSNNKAAENLWYVKQSSENGPFFSLCNVLIEKAVHGTKGGSTGASEFVDSYAYEFVANNTKFKLFEPGTGWNLGSHGSYGGANNSLGRWETGRNGGADFAVEEFDESMFEALNLANGDAGYVGTFSASSTDALTAANTYMSNKTATNLKAALEACNGNVERIAINPNKFYQLISQDGNSNNGRVVFSPAYCSTTGTSSNYGDRNIKLGTVGGAATTCTSALKFIPNGDGYTIQHANSNYYFVQLSAFNHLGNPDLPISTASAGKYLLHNVTGQPSDIWVLNNDNATNKYLHCGYEGDNVNTLVIVTDSPAGNNGLRWKIKEITEVPVTIGSVGYTTVCFPMAVTIPDGVTAYKVTEDVGDKMMLEEVTGSVAAKTPLILEKNGGGDVVFPVVANGEAISDNILAGSTARRVGFAADSFYALAADNSASIGVSFKINGSVNAVPANKAYLPVSNGSVQALYFNLNEEQTTGIESTTLLPNSDSLYNLQGQPVSQPTRGIYVKANGQKVFILK